MAKLELYSALVTRFGYLTFVCPYLVPTKYLPSEYLPHHTLVMTEFALMVMA